MNEFIQLSALIVWLYADVALKVLFLIVLIAAYYNKMSLPQPHRWIGRKLSQYRMSRYGCLICGAKGGYSVWDGLPKDHPCHTCTVSKFFLWRPPSEWRKIDGKD